MKLHYLAYVALLGTLASCSGPKKRNPVAVSEAKEVASQVVFNTTIDTEQSVINWAGHKIGGSHQGTLKLKSGKLAIEQNQLLAGEFIIDMHTIHNLDVTDESMNKRLVDHLKSEDFFDVNRYPEGLFILTQATAKEAGYYEIEGNLTLKEQTKNIRFLAQITQLPNQTYQAVTDSFTIDRTWWGVNYASKSIFKDLKDAIIHDDMDVQLIIVSK